MLNSIACHSHLSDIWLIHEALLPVVHTTTITTSPLRSFLSLCSFLHNFQGVSGWLVYQLRYSICRLVACSCLRIRAIKITTDRGQG